MGKRDEQRKIKLCILNQIKQHRDILFGKLSDTLTRKVKAKKWHEINRYAQSLGAIDTSRDLSYLRDVWWPNVRKCALEKVDIGDKTETNGGKDRVITPVDEEVLSILGPVSPSVCNLGGFQANLLDDIRILRKECLKVKLYKSKLEARKLEIELGMPPSEITSELQTNIVEYSLVNYTTNENE